MSANFIPDEIVALLFQDEARLQASEHFFTVLNILDEYTETRDLLVGAGIDLLTKSPRLLRVDLQLEAQRRINSAMEFANNRTAVKILRATR